MPYRKHSRLNPARYYGKASMELGRRGMILWLLGLTWIFQGITTYTNEPSQGYPLLNGHEWLRGTIWIVSGLIAMWFSRKPPGYDIPGFIALYLMAAFRVVAYGAAFVLWMIPGHSDGNPRGIVGVFSWVTIIILLVAVSGWEENEDKEARDDRI